MKFNTKFERHNHSKPEEFPEKSRVDMLSFIPKERQIQILIQAGQRLRGKGVYDLNPDSTEDIDDLDCDPTRRKDFDLADASNALRTIQNLEELKKAAEKKMKKGPSSPSRSELGPLTPEGSKKAVSVDSDKDKEV